MTLEGSLDAFSLPDIFQLLSFTKKTGALHISGPARGVVWFSTGSVTGATSDTTRPLLGRRLVGAGLVDDVALDAALGASADDPSVGLGKALHEAGAVDEGVLHELVTEQATDAVFDLLRWSAGDFAFQVDEANPDDLGVSLPVEEVITEGRSRLETWEGLTKTVPSPDSIVHVILRQGDGLALAPDEWTLLALTDGHRRVADLVALTGRGEFATVRTLASLVERGLLSIRPADAESNDGVSALVRRQSALGGLELRQAPPVAAPVVDPVAAEPLATPSPTPADPPAAEPAEPVATPAEPVAAPTAPEVVPSRPEPIVARQPEFPEEPVRQAVRAAAAAAAGPTTATSGANALAAAPGSVIERDPSVNKSLLLRLIAGVRGL